MPKTYHRIVFAQGDDANEPLAILDEHGVAAAVEYLAQWDMGDRYETSDRPSHGSSDSTWVSPDGYLLSWNSRLGYIGLERVEVTP